jgi:hypothetical protein
MEAALLSDLETAIYLFREALDRRPSPNPLRSDSLEDFAEALVARFMWTSQIQSLDEVCLLHCEIVNLWKDRLEEMSGNSGQSAHDVRVLQNFYQNQGRGT